MMRPPLCMRGVCSSNDGFLPPLPRGGGHAARVHLIIVCSTLKVTKAAPPIGGIRVSCTLKVCTKCIRWLLEAGRAHARTQCARRACGGAGERRRPRASAAVPCPGAAQTAAEVGARQLCPTFPRGGKVRSTRRGGRTHGPGALGGRAAVRGVPLACLCARLSASRGSERPRLRGVPSGAECDTQCGVRARGRTGRAAARGHSRPPVRQIRGRATPANPHGCER